MEYESTATEHINNTWVGKGGGQRKGELVVLQEPKLATLRTGNTILVGASLELALTLR